VLARLSTQSNVRLGVNKKVSTATCDSRDIARTFKEKNWSIVTFVGVSNLMIFIKITLSLLARK
jgi:hypothetical protein